MKDSRREVLRVLRIVGIGALTCAAIAFAVLALRDGQSAVPAWVNQHAVEVGQPLSAGRPRIVMVPPGILPGGALVETDALLEVPVARRLPERTILTESDLQGSAGTRSLDSDQVLLHLQVPPAVGGRLLPGENVDIWGRDSGCDAVDCPPRMLARAGRVIDVSEVPTGTWEVEKPVTVAVIVRQAEIGPILMSETNGSLNFVLRPVSVPTVKMEGEKQS